MKESICLLVLALLNSSFTIGQTKYKMVIETIIGSKYDYKTDEIKMVSPIEFIAVTETEGD